MLSTDVWRGRERFEPDDRFEGALGRLAAAGTITRAEYLAGTKWRTTYLSYLRVIGAPGYGEPDEFSEEVCRKCEDEHLRGLAILKPLGRRVFHAVNSIAVYEEPLGDPEFTAQAAKIGLAALAKEF